MRIIDLLKVLVNYEVVHTEFPQSFGLLGLTDEKERRIYIEKRQIEREKLDTLIHELIHAYYFSLNKNISEKRVIRETSRLIQYLENEQEE